MKKAWEMRTWIVGRMALSMSSGYDGLFLFT